MAGRIAIMGAGAVGCYYGAMLALAGEDVILIGRPALRDGVVASGLLLEKSGEKILTHPQASTDPAAVAGADLVLFCVKSPDTEATAAQIAPYLAPEAQILSLQNGVTNAARLSAVLGRRAIPTVVYVASTMMGPAHVLHRGRGELVLGTAPQAEAIAARLRKAGIPTEVSDQAETALWTKLVINCALNAISAVTQQPYGHIIATEGVPDLMRGLVAECSAVAQARGITLPDDLWDQLWRIAETMPAQTSSTAQDLARNRPSEIEHLNGEIARQAQALGLPAPLNAAMTALVRLAEMR
ncbi:ketopantoate reductase family protein [Gemmobacter serpentinus]|uniref:ketopantoate reductase family protein n=1 Tax=Gemmobacter serpentinus TaxID=2652247 RepID=UPI00124D235D|nr:2-dehydropantoate 2-reductase [Gemmobacter serpentinus]